MQKFIIGLILMLVVITNILIFTDKDGLHIAVIRDDATPRATQTLGELKVLNWYNRDVFTARTIELPRSSGNLLPLGEYKLALVVNPKQAYSVYGIKGSHAIQMAWSVHDLHGGIGIGKNINVLPKGAVWMNDTKGTFNEFMTLMDGKQDSTLDIRSQEQGEPPIRINVPHISMVGMIWKFIKVIV